jgi:2-polyprenyl-6-methoxyphenol hydroxylase-like FAD-dependent oxidoreductase
MAVGQSRWFGTIIQAGLLAVRLARGPSTIRSMTQHFDICIRGGGIVGYTLALLMARDRLHVGLVASTSNATDTTVAPDVRAYALNAKSRALLESVRCWPDSQHATDVLSMQVRGDDGGEINFAATDLNVPALTWIVDVPTLEARLRDAVRFQPQIEVISALCPATLTVVCEGKASRTREEFGVDFEIIRYPQHAIATRMTCEMPHAQVARQWFSQGEILAFLPLDGAQGKTVAVVWSVLDGRTQTLLDESADVFCEQLQAISNNCLGQLSLISDRKAWALQSAHASRWCGVSDGQAWVLAGDAAHNVHPLAGQGLNLGLGDVAELAKILHGRAFWRPVSDTKLLRQYERSRKTEVAATDTAMTALQQLFSKHGNAWQSLRNWGMKGFEHSGLAKQWAARQAMGI